MVGAHHHRRRIVCALAHIEKYGYRVEASFDGNVVVVDVPAGPQTIIDGDTIPDDHEAALAVFATLLERVEDLVSNLAFKQLLSDARRIMRQKASS